MKYALGKCANPTIKERKKLVKNYNMAASTNILVITQNFLLHFQPQNETKQMYNVE